MPKTVTVAEFQGQQRDASGDREVSTHDVATADPFDLPATDDDAAERLRKIGAPLSGPPMAEQLQALGVEGHCTAEMSLSMIRGRVLEAAYDMVAPAPSDQEIQDEADRILASFDRKGPRQYDLIDGEVRDWRRPDMTPDRGDVTDGQDPNSHAHIGVRSHENRERDPQVTDADFQQSSLFLVPTDAQFNGRLYRDAPELANIAEKLVGEHGFLDELVNCDIRWYWKRKTGVSKGRVKIGFMKRASDLLGHFTGADFIGWLSATTARDGKFSDRQVEAAVFHQLLHVGSDEKGNWIFSPHDFEGFAQEVRHYGTWTSDLKLGGTAFVAAHQMGLFTEDDDEAEDDDGSGVLIHANGDPMTADEIAEMERHELADEAEDDDSLADMEPII